jgi:hypothetical protein
MTSSPSPKSNAPLLVVLGLVVVAILVGASFMAGRFFNRTASTGPQGLDLPDGAVGFGPGGGPGAGGDTFSVELQVTRAPELPQMRADVIGMFLSREDNRLFLSTGNMGFAMTDGGDIAQSKGDGPPIEVVVTQDTKVYRETTQLDPNQPPTGPIQQKVGAGSLDEITENTGVLVWGRRTGDRVIADVLMYSQPMVFRAPGP